MLTAVLKRSLQNMDRKFLFKILKNQKIAEKIYKKFNVRKIEERNLHILRETKLLQYW
jgi:hypothetical protein